MIREKYRTVISYEDIAELRDWEGFVEREIEDLRRRSGLADSPSTGRILKMPVTARMLEYWVVFDSESGPDEH